MGGGGGAFRSQAINLLVSDGLGVCVKFLNLGRKIYFKMICIKINIKKKTKEKTQQKIILFL